MGEPEPKSRGSEAAHDILAAEAFAVPAPDPELRPAAPPEDPTGIPEPHDILAAEEFPMPSGRQRSGLGQGRPARARRTGLAAAAGLLVAFILRRRGRG